MSQEYGKFVISQADPEPVTKTVEKDAIFIGRVRTCDVFLNHKSVSRIHAGINFLNSKYFLINLSSSNVLTINGRILKPQNTDVVADGDIIQIGPFTISAARNGVELTLTVQRQFSDVVMKTEPDVSLEDTLVPPRVDADVADVLEVFWEKRTRDKEEWGTRLRPTAKPQPGKAVNNWKPTRDLQRPWRLGLFIWAILIVGALAAFAYMRYPESYVGKPLANPHAVDIEGSGIALRANGNSCTTCHTLNEPVENACIKCHQAEQFHVSNTKAHEEAGITCTVCHLEHQGPDFEMRESAVQTCAQCHNDDNKKAYNGKTVRTAHGGSYGYPSENGKWNWKGLYSETAEAIPAIKGSAIKGETEQEHLSRQFHAVHVSRLSAPPGVRGDSAGRISCSSCHSSFDPIDRETPRQTCAACHTSTVSNTANASTSATQANCISCHVQHPYSSERWSLFLKNDALTARKKIIGEQIKRLNEQ